MVGCTSDVEFLAKVHCIREASKVEKTHKMVVEHGFFISLKCNKNHVC